MISKPEPMRNGTLQVQSVIIIAITLFALSGLMVGFTVGAFSRSTGPSTNNTNQKNLAARTTPTPTTTQVTPTPVFIYQGPPDLSLLPTPNPDGTLTYSATIQAKDKGNPGKPITTVDGITARIWLVPADTNVNDELNHDTDQLQHPEKFNQPFPKEVPNALVFNPATLTETQACVQGSAKWTFTISKSVPDGKYFLIGLTDWLWKSYNWRWSEITIGNDKKNQK
jgi:hypothetical protein